MVRVLADTDDTHRLERADGTCMGWIRGRAIGLRGLADEPQATAAAVVLWRALDAALRGQFGGWPRHAPALDRLRVMHDGVHEWVTDGSTPVARLLRVEGPPEGASLALEFELPSFASEGVAVAAAQLMGTAFQAHLDASSRARPAPRALLAALLDQEGLADAVPAALDLVERDPLVKAACFPGDLLRALMDVPASFWGVRGRLYARYQAALRAGAVARRALPPAERLGFWAPLDRAARTATDPPVT